MDFSWTAYFGGFWILPFFCLLFMAFMIFGCLGMSFRMRDGAQSSGGRETARQILDRRYANGEIGKAQYDATARDLDGQAPRQGI